MAYYYSVHDVKNNVFEMEDKMAEVEEEFTIEELFDDLEDIDLELDQDTIVNKPPHYGDGEIECIDYMKDNMDTMMFMGYLEGNCKKYLHRYRYKGKPVEDLKKARWYLDRLIQEMEGK
jgi:hypothetical protein